MTQGCIMVWVAGRYDVRDTHTNAHIVTMVTLLDDMESESSAWVASGEGEGVGRRAALLITNFGTLRGTSCGIELLSVFLWWWRYIWWWHQYHAVVRNGGVNGDREPTPAVYPGRLQGSCQLLTTNHRNMGRKCRERKGRWWDWGEREDRELARTRKRFHQALSERDEGKVGGRKKANGEEKKRVA